MKKPNIRIKDRDLRILKFIWKWKLATTAALTKRFFQDLRPHTAYLRLLDLKLGGFIQWRTDARGENFMWTLTPKGFAAMRDSIEVPLKEEGFASEHIHHDLLVSAIHLGDWFLAEPKGVCLFSEQQLRRYSTEYLPSWIPDVQSHRPDGYWYMPEGQSFRLVALEVELNLKQAIDYERVGRFYGRCEKLDGVLWVVQRPWMASHILSLLERGSARQNSIHSFAFVKDFISEGWLAKIKVGADHGKSIQEVLLQSLTKVARNSGETFLSSFILDTRKTVTISRPSHVESENTGSHNRVDSHEGGN